MPLIVIVGAASGLGLAFLKHYGKGRGIVASAVGYTGGRDEAGAS